MRACVQATMHAISLSQCRGLYCDLMFILDIVLPARVQWNGTARSDRSTTTTGEMTASATSASLARTRRLCCCAGARADMHVHGCAGRHARACACTHAGVHSLLASRLGLRPR